MTLSDRNEALAAFRKAQRKANEQDKLRYRSEHPQQTPAPSPQIMTARERALLHAEQQGE